MMKRNSLNQDDIISNINTLAQTYGLVEKGKSYTSKKQLAKELGRNFNLDVQLGDETIKGNRGKTGKRCKKVEDRGNTGTTPAKDMGLEENRYRSNARYTRGSRNRQRFIRHFRYYFLR